MRFTILRIVGDIVATGQQNHKRGHQRISQGYLPRLTTHRSEQAILLIWFAANPISGFCAPDRGTNTQVWVAARRPVALVAGSGVAGETSENYTRRVNSRR